MSIPKTSPPIRRLVFAISALLVAAALWIYSNCASAYVLQPILGDHVVYYVESSNGCLLLLVLWDKRSMGALPSQSDLHGPVTPVYRSAFFGHEDGTKLRPFQVFTSIQSLSSAFGFTLPYWLFIIAAVGYGSLLLRRWRGRFQTGVDNKGEGEKNA
jgi:hypothetical protein